MADVARCAERLNVDINEKFILKVNPSSTKKG